MSGTLTYSQALSIGASAMRYTESIGKHVSIAIVNHDGRPLFTLAMEQAAPFTADIALKKARICAATHESTRMVSDAVRSGECTQAAYGIIDADFVAWAGGFPIYEKGICIGGIGVSGLEEERDEEVAEKALRDAGYSNYTDGHCLDTLEGIQLAHHLGIGLPVAAVEALAAALTVRGAVLISRDRQQHKYFFRLNPLDSTLVELFVEATPSIHVDYAVADLARVEAFHGNALITYPGISALRFLTLIDGDPEVQIAFRQTTQA